MITSDFHTHTTFCDGSNTAREMVEAAVEKGYSALGISGHSHTSCDESYCMSKSGTEQYIKEIKSLKTAFNGTISVFYGIEFDALSDDKAANYDYAIGSVHNLIIDEKLYVVDKSPYYLKSVIEEDFHGDSDSFAEAYYSKISQFADNPDIDVIGHFDFVAQFNRTMPLFDVQSRRYVSASDSALDRLAAANKIFEFNTSRFSGGFSVPSERLLKGILACNGKVALGSDSHCTATLGQRFDSAEAYLKSLGFKTLYALGTNGFEPCEL